VLAKKIFVYLKNASRSGLAEVHSIHRVDQAAAISISVDKIINVLGPLFVANMHRSSVSTCPPPHFEIAAFATSENVQELERYKLLSL